MRKTSCAYSPMSHAVELVLRVPAGLPTLLGLVLKGTLAALAVLRALLLPTLLLPVLPTALLRLLAGLAHPLLGLVLQTLRLLAVLVLGAHLVSLLGGEGVELNQRDTTGQTSHFSVTM
jgi:hypothetical protein